MNTTLIWNFSTIQKSYPMTESTIKLCTSCLQHNFMVDDLIVFSFITFMIGIGLGYYIKTEIDKIKKKLKSIN